MGNPAALTVLFDERCPFCVRAAEWLRGQAALVPLELLGCGSERARARFGELPWLGRELVVVADDGAVWAGPGAFIVCLWALDRWRGWAVTLAERPWLAALAARFFAWVSVRRHWLAGFVGHHPCNDGLCLAPSRGGPYR